MSETPHPEVDILNALLELPADEHAGYLDRACEGDAALRRQVETLWAAHVQADGFLDSPPPGLDPGQTVRVAIPITEKPGDKIGRYKLLQRIGEGGCGVVYMAEQEEPVKRRVALKVIKLGMDTRSVIARFEAERQALALMDHPNIAKVLDAGATETGRPYFVMELVRGIRVTDYCDQNHLSTRERLGLFVQICKAIQHAHQKGIIHRDIKPSNILITVNDGSPVPKVIDFGIAKATQGRLTDKTLFTAFEQFIGTPAYMSPEQAEMTSLDIDTRSDVYSLGVLLYELLTGKTPFDAQELLQAGFDEMRRRIRETEPPKPSTRLVTMLDAERLTAAQRRHTDSPKLVHLVRGDLDWIAMKALEKDRTRRYETANGLAADIQRHLDNEPVTACPPSGLYRVRKAVQRNKGAVMAGAAIVLVLVVGVVVSASQAIRARRAERNQAKLREQAEAGEKKARTEAARSRQTSLFLEDMLRGVGPSVALGRDTTMLREIVDRTRERIRTDLKDQPAVQVELGLTLTHVYGDLSLATQEEEMARETLLVARTHFAEESLEVADSLGRLGRALNFTRKLKEAEMVTREAIVLQRKLRGPGSLEEASGLRNLCDVLRNGSDMSGSPADQSRLAEAEACARAGKAIVKKRLGNESVELGWSCDTLSLLLSVAGKFDEAEAVAREGLAMRRRMYGENHPETASALTWLSRVLMGKHQFGEAEASLRQGLAIDIAMQTTNSWGHAIRLSHLEWALEMQGKWADAESCLREAVMVVRQQKSEDDAERFEFIRRLAVVLGRNGKPVEARAAYEEVAGGLCRLADRGDVTDRGIIDDMSSAALILSGCPFVEVRDGSRAVKYAERAVAATGRQNSLYLDALATAYAETGDFAKATNAENEAITLPGNEAYRKNFKARLSLYETNAPFRFEY